MLKILILGKDCVVLGEINGSAKHGPLQDNFECQRGTPIVESLI